jgi:hypothetical protein
MIQVRQLLFFGVAAEPIASSSATRSSPKQHASSERAISYAIAPPMVCWESCQPIGEEVFSADQLSATALSFDRLTTAPFTVKRMDGLRW